MFIGHSDAHLRSVGRCSRSSLSNQRIPTSCQDSRVGRVALVVLPTVVKVTNRQQSHFAITAPTDEAARSVRTVHSDSERNVVVAG